LGDHGITIMSCRESLSFKSDLQSDAAPLNHLIAATIAAAPHTRCFRDPTRGGLASTLNELASQSGVNLTVEEDAIPVKSAVLGACEMLGYDALQVANEGKMVCVVAADEAPAALAAMRANPYGIDAAIVGEASIAQPERGSKVFLRTSFGSTRILDMLVGEQLPRIC
ncbi:MAG: AIR synthase-related protein, partial [Raoultibacter sp.]